jgi:hypothetical protein
MSATTLEGRARRLARQIGWRIRKRYHYYLLIDNRGAIIIDDDSIELNLRQAMQILLKV